MTKKTRQRLLQIFAIIVIAALLLSSIVSFLANF